MNEQPNIEATVKLVSDGLTGGASEAQIAAQLVAAGIPAADATDIFRAVKSACQQGVQSIITEGLSAPNGPPRDPLLAEAFRVGQQSMRRAVQGVWLKRFLRLIAIALAIFALTYIFK